MYKCQRCKRVSTPKEKANRVVVETRIKDYYENINGLPVFVGTGHETVREITVCEECYAELSRIA